MIKILNRCYHALNIRLASAHLTLLLSALFVHSNSHANPLLEKDTHHAFYHAPASVLQANFVNPPEQVKPWVYWYWISDHVSKTGIENDLAAMQKAGISTALIGIIHLRGKQGEVTALSEPWWEHVRFAIKTAAKYNIDIGLFNSPGWSQSGGPWVGLDKSMRYLDSTEYNVKSGQQVNLTLPSPTDFYQDVRVLAFKTPAFENIILAPSNSKLAVSQVTIDPNSGKNTHTLIEKNNANELFDGDVKTVYRIPQSVLNHERKGTKSNGVLQLDFTQDTPFDVRTIEIHPHNTFTTQVTLSAKNSAGVFEPIKTFELQRPFKKANIGPDHDAPIVVSFPAVSSQHFRLTFNGFKFHGRSKPDEYAGIKEIVLSKGYKLERYVEKKLAKVFPNPSPKFDSYLWPFPTPAQKPNMIIKQENVLDITSQVKNNTLNWQAPHQGDWTIVRYFMRTTGTENGPSSKAARGPEIDKLSKPIAQFHFDAYIGHILNTMPAQDRTALKYAVVDSYEQGAQNWTDNFAQKFKAHYNYDPIPYLPVYTGRVVNSVEKSERFLWDVRRFVADGVAYEYTAGLRERANENGLKLWLENYGHWGFPGEFLQYGGQADIVSGEFWASGNLGSIELKAASSAAHIYGHKTIMSESFTAGRSSSFKNHPWNFKKRGDWSFVEGVNHTLLHVYIHQAYEDTLPGVNAWFGSEFNRHNTWFDFMGSWLDYIKRANYLMQQGNYVADIMYFIGEDAPKMTGEINPALPHGYSYDFINAEVILNRLTFKNGAYYLPNGTTFSLLVLPNLDNIRPAVLQKIQTLVKQGGVIYGPKPQRSPSLKNYPHADKEVKQLADTLWQNIDGKKVQQTQYGKGYIFYSQDKNVDLTPLLKKAGSTPDITNLPNDIIWSHRSSDTHDIYFIANQLEKTVNIQPSLRFSATHGQPYIYNAVTGNIKKAAHYTISDNRIVLPFELKGLESTFFVFEKNNTKTSKTPSLKNITYAGNTTWLPTEINHNGNTIVEIAKNGDYTFTTHKNKVNTAKITDIPTPVILNKPWQLTFEENRDVPTSLTLDSLTSLTNLTPYALKHYSGSIQYATTFELTDTMLRSDHILQLDLGEVGVIANVTLNGKHLGDVWSRPMTLDISDAAKKGKNHLVINVATTWQNRRLADHLFPEVFPDGTPKTFSTNTTFEHAKIPKKPVLQPSGLIGPVSVSAIKKHKL